MLTFQALDFLIVVFAVLVLIAGLTHLTLRRRNEILEDYLTPEEPDIEQEFFKKKIVVAEPEEEKPVEEAPAEEVPPENEGWGTG